MIPAGATYRDTIMGDGESSDPLHSRQGSNV